MAPNARFFADMVLSAALRKVRRTLVDGSGAKFVRRALRLSAARDVVGGTKPRYARPDEILMNLAYSASHGSKCLKRQVGAVGEDSRHNHQFAGLRAGIRVV